MGDLGYAALVAGFVIAVYGAVAWVLGHRNGQRELLDSAVRTFYRLREIKGIEKKPATRELINWIRALRADADFRPKDLVKGEVPYLGVLFKKSPDYGVAQNAIPRFRI